MTEKQYFGTLASDPLGSWPYQYFLPDPIEPIKILREETWEQVVMAHSALGELDAVTRLLVPNLRSNTALMLQEALASSRIEGTQASFAEVLETSMSTKQVLNPDVEEVLNYQKALLEGLELIKELPLSRRLTCRIHEVLMQGKRGIGKSPGLFRTTPVWIGSAYSTPATATFVPPLPMHLTELFSHWEKYVNSSDQGLLVIKTAWAHYHFETIHPFLDGNGRIGRILFELQLIVDQRLSGPYLGISRYIERTRQDYYSVLQKVRTHGDFDGLVRYFATGIEIQATEVVAKVVALVALKERWLAKFSSESKNMPQLIGLLVENPIVDVQFVTSSLGISQPTASKLLRQTEGLGILKTRGQQGQGRRESWIAQEAWEILSPTEAA